LSDTAPSSGSQDVGLAKNQGIDMALLGNIFNRIFNRGGKPQDPTTAQAGDATASNQAGAAAGGTTASAGSVQATAAVAAEPVDVEAVLNEMSSKSTQKLNWRTSIVDLLKLLDLDSSLQARKELADELGYSGDKNDSASMNIWLHKQVMRKLAENGGKVPADLKD
jgi:hypothetical protein